MRLSDIGGKLSEGYRVVPGFDRERYQERQGLEGPFHTKSGKVVYYDKQEGKYYDPDTDMYIEYEDWQAMNEQGVAEGYNDLGPEYGGAYVNGRSDDARMTERLTRQAKAAAAKAGKTFSTSAEYRKWHARQKEKQGVAEVSKATLDQYVPKAVDAHGHADFSARMSKDDPTKRSYHVDQKRTAEKRRQGISRALDRMSKMEGVAEGPLDNPGHQDSPVASAITRRILLQRTDLLAKHGPEKVMNAIDEVADFVGDVDEIGSSDVSGWIRHVEQMLGNMGESQFESVDTLKSALGQALRNDLSKYKAK